MAFYLENISGNKISAEANGVSELLLKANGRVPDIGSEHELAFSGNTLIIRSGMLVYTGVKVINDTDYEIEITPETVGSKTLYVNMTLNSILNKVILEVSETSAGSFSGLSDILLGNPISVSFELGTINNTTSGILGVTTSVALTPYLPAYLAEEFYNKREIDAAVVKLTGDQIINGTKTFSLRTFFTNGLTSLANIIILGGYNGGGTTIGANVNTDGDVAAKGNVNTLNNVNATKALNGATLNTTGNASIANGDTQIGQNVISIGYHQAKNFIANLVDGTVGIRMDNDASDMSTIMEPLRAKHGNGNNAIRFYRNGSTTANERYLVLNSFDTDGNPNAGILIGRTISTGEDYGMVQHLPGNGNRYKLAYFASTLSADIQNAETTQQVAQATALLLENQQETSVETQSISFKEIDKLEKTRQAMLALADQQAEQIIAMNSELEQSVISESEEKWKNI